MILTTNHINAKINAKSILTLEIKIAKVYFITIKLKETFSSVKILITKKVFFKSHI